MLLITEEHAFILIGHPGWPRELFVAAMELVRFLLGELMF